MNSSLYFIERSLPYLCLLIYVLAAAVGTFAGGLWAALGIGGAILMFLGTWISLRKTPSLDFTLVVFVGLIIGTIALLYFDAQYQYIAFRRSLQLVTILVPLTLLYSPQVQTHINHDRLFPFVTIAALVGALALGVELILGGPLLHAVKGSQASLTQYNRGISYLVVFAFPLMAYLWSTRRRWELALFILILLIPASLTESRATRMAFVFGIATTIVAFISPVTARRALVVILFALLAFPFGVMEIFLHDQSWIKNLPPSWQDRVEIWDYMSYRIFERPYLGWGMGSSHLLPFQLPHGNLYHFVTTEAANPHNVIIQLWVELGLPGLVLGYLFALLMLYRASKFPSPFVPFAFGAWVACWSISLVAYDFWSDSLFSLFALTPLAFMLLIQQKASHETRG